MATNTPASQPVDPAGPDPANSAGTGPQSPDEPADQDHGDDDTGAAEDFRDPKITAALAWDLGDNAKQAKRRSRLQKVIDAGGMRLHRDHLEWARYVLNWADVEKTLPLPRKDGRWAHRGGHKTMSGYTVYYLNLIMPAQVLIQQIMNYRLDLGRSLPRVPTADKPVSVAVPMADDQGKPLMTLLHTYATPDGLQKTLTAAHDKLVAYRNAQHGWEPLRDMIHRDGVEDGGFWLQTVFAPAGESGDPNLDAAAAALAPADAASRKAVCDSRTDPENVLAAVPLFAPRRSDVFGPDIIDPSGPMTVAETIGTVLGRVKRAVKDSGALYLDDLPDEVRELLQTVVMPIRLVYAVEDSRGRPADLDAVGVFRQIQEHLHGQDHLNHPESEAERLLADLIREELHTAVDDGQFTIVDPATRTNRLGETVTTEWTRELIDVLSGHAGYAELAGLGLPATRLGAGVAAALLVYGNGPERAIIGKVLGSRRNRGRYDDLLQPRRAALLRELTFPDKPVNTRAFEPMLPKQLWESQLIAGWDGNTDALIDKVAAGTDTPVERTLFDIVAITAAADAGMQVVDVGSSGANRGFFRQKAINAIGGTEVVVDKALGRRRSVLDPAGRPYMQALLTGRLLQTDPKPAAGLDAPTIEQWQQWAAAGVGRLGGDGLPQYRKVIATVVDDNGEISYDPDGTVRRTTLSMPELVDPKAFDRFSTRNMQIRGVDEYKRGMSGASHVRPPTPDEQTGTVLGQLAGTLTGIGTGITDLEKIAAGGHILSDPHRNQITDIGTQLRNLARVDVSGCPILRLDDLLSEDRRRAQERDLAAAGPDAAGDPADEEDDEDEVRDDFGFSGGGDGR